MNKDPELFVKWYDFLKWILVKTEKFPKSVRFSFSNRINNLALDVVEGIVEAMYSKKKIDILRRIDLNMEKLRILLRLCNDLKHLDYKGYEFASLKLNECGKMVGGWRRNQEGREA